MKSWAALLGCTISFISAKAQTTDYSKYPVYNGNDLGLTYNPAQSTFRIWAPTAKQAELLLHNSNVAEGKGNAVIPMKASKQGTWVATVKGDKKNLSYAFRVNINEQWSEAVQDPYVKTVVANGKWGVVTDLKKTNPAGWEKDKSPLFKNKLEAVIYELHVRDASISSNSGIKNKGKFVGLTEAGTKNKSETTGLDHLKELGVTHIHLLPSYDYNSVDETNPDATYNWGYDPLNYNVPEGSYATDVNDAATRVREFKQLVKTFHENGLRVVLDVVYNHTAQTNNSNFNQLVPGYYYRQTSDGKFSNATACGNETASERPMFRKFMLESMLYWVKEYHIDGFRVDLMGVHDIATMNHISRALHKLKPDILIYGEGWTAGSSPLPDSLRALKKNVTRLDRIAVFSDDIRDGIKGSVFEHKDKGFASGKPGMEESIKFGIVAGVQHPQVDYTKVNYSKAPYATEPFQTITYAECHDNHVLWDKLTISAEDASVEERKAMHKLALAIVMTSQGIPFLHAGTEFLRSKKGVENSFDSPDSINAIDWNLKTDNKELFDYVQALIKLRKDHPAFRMTTSKAIRNNLAFAQNQPAGIVAYTIDGKAAGDSWNKILVFFNGNAASQKVSWPTGQWKFFDVSGTATDMSLPATSGTSMAPFSWMIAYQ